MPVVKEIRVEDPYKPFKARSAPATTGELGHGGQLGIPKVMKRSTTTPVSPKLGMQLSSELKTALPHVQRSRLCRKKKERHSHNRARPVSTPIRRRRPSGQDPYVPFKARPLPVTTGDLGHGGQIGVPKVSKKPPTVPNSPRLGTKGDMVGRKSYLKAGSKPVARSKDMLSENETSAFTPFKGIASGSEASRAKDTALRERIEREDEETRRKSTFKARPLPASVTENRRTNSPGLIGLGVLESRSRFFREEENADPNHRSSDRSPGSPTKKQRCGTGRLPLHSTEQAEKRAAFEKARTSNEQNQRLRMKKEREDLIQKKQKKLNKLRDSLC